MCPLSVWRQSPVTRPRRRVVVRTGHDAVVREGGDAVDLRPSWRRTESDCAVRRDAGAALCPCAHSPRHRPLDASQTLTCCPTTRTRRGRATGRRRNRPAPVAASTNNRPRGSTGAGPRAAVPGQRPRHEPLDTSHTLSVLSGHPDPDTRRQCDRTTTQLTCSPDCRRSFDGTPAPRVVRVPAQLFTQRMRVWKPWAASPPVKCQKALSIDSTYCGSGWAYVDLIYLRNNELALSTPGRRDFLVSMTPSAV